MNLSQIINQNSLKAYQKYLESQSLPSSTIKRKLSSLAKFRTFAEIHYLKKDSSQLDQNRAKTISLPAATKPRWFGTFGGLQGAKRLKDSSEPSVFSSFTPYLTMAVLALFSTALGIFGYNQIFKQAEITQAYPTTPQTPNR